MSVQAILIPMFVQVGLTFVLLFWMGALRLSAIRTGQVDPCLLYTSPSPRDRS